MYVARAVSDNGAGPGESSSGQNLLHDEDVHPATVDAAMFAVHANLAKPPSTIESDTREIRWEHRQCKLVEPVLRCQHLEMGEEFGSDSPVPGPRST